MHVDIVAKSKYKNDKKIFETFVLQYFGKQKHFIFVARTQLTHTSAYLGIRNISFSEHFADILKD